MVKGGGEGAKSSPSRSEQRERVRPVASTERTDALREEIQWLVKNMLVKHEYPREVTFVDELPQTTGTFRGSALRERET